MKKANFINDSVTVSVKNFPIKSSFIFQEQQDKVVFIWVHTHSNMIYGTVWRSKSCPRTR